MINFRNISVFFLGTSILSTSIVPAQDVGVFFPFQDNVDENLANYSDLAQINTLSSAPGNSGTATLSRPNPTTGTLAEYKNNYGFDYTPPTPPFTSPGTWEQFTHTYAWQTSGNEIAGALFDLSIDLTGIENIEVFMFSDMRYGAAGTVLSTTDITLDYSTDGGSNFNTFGTQTSGGFALSGGAGSEEHGTSTFDLSSLTSIEDQNDVVLRFILPGVSGGGGNIRIDNFQLTGAAIPEPSSLILMLGGIAATVLFLRRR